MAAPAVVQSLITYYVQLLIIQYRTKGKARADIGLIIQWLLANAVIIDVLNGYNIDPTLGPTGVGAQLDIIGKYVGVSRYYATSDLVNYFGFTSYTEVDPDADPKFGFSDYADYSQFSYNGTLTYDSIITSQNALSDSDFLTVIQLGIMLNTCAMGHGELDQKLFNIFATSIRMESLNMMRAFYFIVGPVTPLVQAIIAQKLFPKAMGVQISYVQQNAQLIYGMISYDEIVQPDEYGFSDYADYDTTAGAVLTYDQILTG